MTVSERAFPENLREKLAQRKLPAATPEKPSDSGDIARRFITYMVDADRRRFLIGLEVRLVGHISLILVPVFTGLALDILQQETASQTDLLLLVGGAMVAGVVFWRRHRGDGIPR